MIFDDTPTDWQQLEDRVTQAFNEMGCTATRNVVIPTVRSSSQVDVYVNDPTITPPAVYLCECKHWGRRVPKRVVQQFRSVMSDSGANLGIIISEKGFQSGAHEAAASTSIRLYSWNDFLVAYEQRWTKAMSMKFKALLDECQDLAWKAYHTDPASPSVVPPMQLLWEMFHGSILLTKVASAENAIVTKSAPFRFCESAPEQTAGPDDTWRELKTARVFYDYAIPQAEAQKARNLQWLAIMKGQQTI